MATATSLDEIQLKAKRQALRTQITKGSSTVVTNLANDSLTGEEIRNLEARINVLSNLFKQTVTINEALEPTYAPDEFEKELEKNIEYEFKIEELRLAVSDRQNKLSSNVAMGKVSGMTLTTQQFSRAPILINLPKIDIKPFAGEFYRWKGFWGQFSNSVDRHSDIPDADKLQYLIGLLAGPPYHMVSDLEVIDENYKKAVDRLQERYGKVKNLKELHVDALLELKVVRNINDLEALRELESEVAVHTSALTKLGVDVEVFFSRVKKKFPKELVFSFKQDDRESRTVNDLLAFIREELSELEGWDQVSGVCHTGPTSSKIKTAREKTTSTTVSLTANVNNKSNQLNRPIMCVFCNVPEHWSRDCIAELTLTEKRDILIAKGKCLSCLKGGHIAADCPFNFYPCRRCKGLHFQSMCPQHPFATAKKSDKPALGEEPAKTISAITVVASDLIENRHIETEVPEETKSVAVLITSTIRHTSVLLQTARANLIASEKQLPVICLLDNGSQRCFIRDTVSRSLQLPIVGYETVTISGFAGHPTVGRYPRVRFELASIHNSKKVRMEALEVPHLTDYVSPAKDSVLNEKVKQLMELGLTVADPYGEKPGVVDIIVGADYINRVTAHRRMSIDENLTAIETMFGWTLQGVVDYRRLSRATDEQKDQRLCALVSTVFEHPETFDDTLQKFWKLEALGIKEEIEDDQIEDDYEAEFKKRITMMDGRYYVNLPWKETKKELLNDNYDIAVQRLKNTVRRLRRISGAFELYDAGIKQYLTDGHAEIVKEKLSHSGTFYVPTLPVTKEERSTKLRIVFDGSSHGDNELSVNDCLFAGSNRSLDVVKILLQFRSGDWAMTADIKKAFLQIGVKEEDRDAVRFLWLDSSKSISDQLMEPVIYRMIRLAFGLTCSPYILRQVLTEHALKYVDRFPEAVELLLKSLYVDDIIAALPDQIKLQEILTQITSMLNEAGFQLHKTFNNWENKTEEQYTKVLGMGWDLTLDELIIFVPDLESITRWPLTKRKMVQTSASIYDPLGYLSPITIISKLLIQDAWARGYGWDDEIKDDILTSWKRWIEETKKHPQWNVNRFAAAENQIGTLSKGEFQLHFFSDALPQAFGSVVYLVYEDVKGVSRSSLLFAKFRAAPLKCITLPRLELMAATLSARVAEYLKINWSFHPKKKTFWTDSAITYFWITKMKNKVPTFVSNRVREIRKVTHENDWRHCSGSENPADLATKSAGDKLQEDTDLWWKGPEWICLVKERWPNSKILNSRRQKGLEELNIDETTLLNTNVVQVDNEWIPEVDIYKCRDFGELIKLTTNELKQRQPNDKTNETDVEIDKKSRLFWIKTAQKQVFAAEIKQLLSTTIVARTSRLFALKPFLDDEGVVRLQGRLQSETLTLGEKHPIVLPADNIITTKIIQEVHNTTLHAGVSTMLNLLRQEFWIISGRRQCKKVIYSCHECRKANGEFIKQPTAPLPPERTTLNRPFEVVGIDFAGPTYVAENTNKKTVSKCYIALFTCAASRAIHLELVTSLSSEDFIMAFRRFIGRRGAPAIVYTDNATTFKKATKELKDLPIFSNDGQKAISGFLRDYKIEWRRIVERAPWWGGFWERMVRSLKTPIKKTLGKALLRYDELLTLIVEVEAILNSRPLAVINDDLDDLQILTPAHLVLGYDLMRIGYRKLEFMPEDDLLKAYRFRKELLMKLIDCWKKEYLLQLRSAHMSHPRLSQKINIGDICLLNVPNVPRHHWPLARVIDAQPGRDGIVRACTVMTPEKKIFRRAVDHLIPLENTSRGGRECYEIFEDTVLRERTTSSPSNPLGENSGCKPGDD